jgi:hypothetical protein
MLPMSESESSRHHTAAAAPIKATYLLLLLLLLEVQQVLNCLPTGTPNIPFRQ